MDFLISYGEICRQHRKASGLSQTQLATLAGVGKTVVFDIEAGKPTIKLATLIKVFSALNISIILDSPYLRTNQNG